MALKLEEERLIAAWESGSLGGQPQAVELARIASRLRQELEQTQPNKEKR